MSKKRIINFEEQLERLIEGSFARLFYGALQPREVAIRLIRAIEDNTRSADDGREAAPTHYTIRLHPADHTSLLKRTSDFHQLLTDQVITYCQETGLYLHNTPELLLVQDVHLPRHVVQITADHSNDKRDTTQMMTTINQQTPAGPMPEAQLIIDDKRLVPLNEPIINIGRHPDNEIVLSNLHVSRHHIQIRLRFGEFMLYDRQSRSGTYVNGQRVLEHILTSGDVIRIGDVTLIYEEAEHYANELNDTMIDMQPPDLPEGR